MGSDQPAPHLEHAVTLGQAWGVPHRIDLRVDELCQLLEIERRLLGEIRNAEPGAEYELARAEVVHLAEVSEELNKDAEVLGDRFLAQRIGARVDVKSD